MMDAEFLDYVLEGSDLPRQVLDTPAAELVTNRQRTRIRAKWMQPARSTYPVPGSTVDEMCSFFRAKVEKEEEWALFRFEIHWEPLQERSANIIDAVFTAKSSITMPKWRALRTQPPEVQSDWNNMYTKLLRHEHRHVQKYRGKFNAEIRRLRQTASTRKRYLTRAELAAELTAIVAACQYITDQYDADTEHGKKEGVVLQTCMLA